MQAHSGAGKQEGDSSKHTARKARQLLHETRRDETRRDELQLYAGYLNTGDILFILTSVRQSMFLCGILLTLEYIAQTLVVHLGRTVEHVAALCEGIRQIFCTLRLSGTRRASWSASHLEI